MARIARLAADGSDGQARGVTRRGVMHWFGVGAAGLALGRTGYRPALAQQATVTAEADPEPEDRVEVTPAAGGTPVGSAGKLTIYSGRSEGLVGPLMANFERATGIDAAIRYAGTPELAATILEEGNGSPADVFFAQDAGALGLLANEGRFQKLADDLLSRVPARFRSPDGLWVGASGRARVLVYNTGALQESDLPTSVLTLTDATWKDKIGWAPENASFQAFVTALRVLKGEDAARAWLKGMLANKPVNFADSNTAVTRAVGEGEIQVGLVNHYYLYEVKKEEGNDFPIANHFFAAGDPGSLVNAAGVGILKDAKNATQARRFVDYLLGTEAQTYFAEQTDEYPLIAGIPTAPGLKPLAEIESPDIDLSDLADLKGTVALLTDVGVL
jgi:iron(III) transport system substrate-binding protein